MSMEPKHKKNIILKDYILLHIIICLAGPKFFCHTTGNFVHFSMHTRKNNCIIFDTAMYNFVTFIPIALFKIALNCNGRFP